jgi:hypothetical protein
LIRAAPLKPSVGPLPVMTMAHRIVVVVILGWFALCLVTIGSCVVRTNSLDRAYAQVRVGDTKGNVVAALGEPSQIDSCLGPVDGEKLIPRCSEVIHYYSQTHSWWFFIDTDGKVQLKGHKFRF